MLTKVLPAFQSIVQAILICLTTTNRLIFYTEASNLSASCIEKDIT